MPELATLHVQEWISRHHSSLCKVIILQVQRSKDHLKGIPQLCSGALIPDKACVCMVPVNLPPEFLPVALQATCRASSALHWYLVVNYVRDDLGTSSSLFARFKSPSGTATALNHFDLPILSHIFWICYLHKLFARNHTRIMLVVQHADQATVWLDHTNTQSLKDAPSFARVHIIEGPSSPNSLSSASEGVGHLAGAILAKHIEGPKSYMSQRASCVH